MTTDDLLARLDLWLTTHAPALAADMTGGATQAELNALELGLGHTLPESHRALLRRHAFWGKIFGGLEHVPLSQVLTVWKSWQSAEDMNWEEWDDPFTSAPEGAIQPLYTCPGWVPLLTDKGGNHIGLDFAPGPSGWEGQVISYGRDTEQKYVLAPDLSSFLAEYLARLEAGQVWVGTLQSQPSPQWALRLRDAEGHIPAFYDLHDLFPGFGALPPLLPPGRGGQPR